MKLRGVGGIGVELPVRTAERKLKSAQIVVSARRVQFLFFNLLPHLASMEHLHSRLPYSQWRLQILRQLFRSVDSSSPTFLSRRVYSNDAQANLNTTTSQDSQNNHSTNDTDTPSSTIPPSQSLPQSPILTNPHPGRDLRHRKKRRPIARDLNDLDTNPWAKALASPIRMCNITYTRMPKALMLDWGLVEGPVSSAEPSHDPIASSEASASPDANEGENKDSKLWFLPVGLLKDDLVNPFDKKKGSKEPVTSSHLGIRTVDRLPMLQKITKATDNPRKRRYSDVLFPILPQRWKRPLGPMTEQDGERLVWRGDMPDFVARLKRREILEKLKHVSDTFKSQKTWSKTWISFDAQEPYSESALLEGLEREELARKQTLHQMETGVFIIFGNSCEIDAGAKPVEAVTVPELVTLPETGRKVAVLDLRRLLLPAEIEEIRAYHPRFQKLAAILKPSNRLMADTILALWNLQGYLRECTQPYASHNSR
ncbi:hypothetical protein BDV06DRAFT_198867 [Aspergillus oleicola]